MEKSKESKERFEAAIITISDKGSRGERLDTSGASIREILEKNQWDVKYYTIIPDEQEQIEDVLKRCSDEMKIPLVLTTGGTGFSKRDVTPEATKAVIEKEALGIAEAMRYESLKVTPMGMLSRATAGIRKHTLIVNLPGSEKAVRECLDAVIKPLYHGVGILLGSASECGQAIEKKEEASNMGTVRAVCISEKKGVQKKNVHRANLIENFGIEGDAHAGNWHRQVSLLSYDKVEQFRQAGAPVVDGSFGENLIIEGIDFKTLPIGTKFKCNDIILELTQIGKECHSGCEIFQIMGDCIMPREGVFAIVLHGGLINEGDKLEIIE